MWPIILLCLAGCLLAVGSVWLYEVEHVLRATEEHDKLRIVARTALDQGRSPVGDRRGAAGRTRASVIFEHGVGASVSISGEFRHMSNGDLMRQALALEAELRASERRYFNERIGRRGLPHEKPRDSKEREFRQRLLPQAVSLANELLFRLGSVEAPSDVRSLSLKLGAAMIASGEPAGPNPISPVANFLVFLTRKLPQ